MQEDARRIRPSRAGKRRAWVLLGVHLLFALHLAHWLATGESMTLLEPSEAMEFSKHSIVNAGLVFFALTLLSTMVFGRWFCGWACHLVALQDGCRWLMLKIGIRPKPLRSRLLLWVPLIACFYMFLWPLVYRVWIGDDLAIRGTEFVSAGFWDTMPGLVVGIGTLLVCGFAAVYFLGAKGFCTYACPYGAAFALLDRVAPGRIRVDDNCEHCGHCTAVCSSNVVVHREVRDFGMVVDPGCMKCLDCVSVCPNDALSFGFGGPALFAKPRVAAPERPKPALGWGEEIGLALAFAAAFFSFRGLYQLVPFLGALGLAGILAYLVAQLVRSVRAANLRIHRLQIKREGRWTTGGIGFAGVFLVFLMVWVHSALVQGHGYLAERSFEGTREARARLIAVQMRPVSLTPGERAAATTAREHSEWVRRNGLVLDPENSLRLSWLGALEGDAAAFEGYLREALERVPNEVAHREILADWLGERDRVEEAELLYREIVASGEPSALVLAKHGYALQLLGRHDEALTQLRASLGLHPHAPLVQEYLGVSLEALGRTDEAADAFEAAGQVERANSLRTRGG